MNSKIADVRIKSLKLLPNAKGRLMEVQRRDEPDFPGFGQVYITQSFPGVIKAWYRHHVQIDQIAVISGLARLVLFDGREDRPSHGVVEEIMMGELAPRLVVIPPGVWHGFQAVGESSAFFLHLNTEPFDANAPDEDRIDCNDPAIPFSW